MTDQQLCGLNVRHPKTDDHLRVLAVMEDWWGGIGGAEASMQRALQLPHLFFKYFYSSSWLAEDDTGGLKGFLIGLISQSDPTVGYIHFVSVDPKERMRGLGSGLYRLFFNYAINRNCRTVQAVTSPQNHGSIAFHTRLGFEIMPSSTVVDGVAIHSDYDGPGLDRVVFCRPITDVSPSEWSSRCESPKAQYVGGRADHDEATSA